VVLVPGLTGSGLEAQLSDAPMPHSWCKTSTGGSWMRVWVALSQLLPREKDCLIARLQLTYNATDGTYANRPGVRVRAVDFGGVGGIDVLDPVVPLTAEFKAMIAHLQTAHGYEVGKTLFGAPYDWRLAGDGHARLAAGVGGYYVQLQRLIERAVQETGQKVVIVSHSLGCPTMLYFFNRFVSEEWGIAHIHSWVALAGPWMGSIEQVTSYLGGNTLGVGFVPHDYVRAIQVNATSGVWLSPHPKAFGNATIVTTPSRSYTSADVPELVSTIGDGAGGSQTSALFAKAPAELLGVQRLPRGFPVHNWFSSGRRTVERLDYSSDVGPGFDAAPAATHYGDGDGTVNLLSLKQPMTWEQGPSMSLELMEFPGASHFEMLTDERVLEALSQHLEGSSSRALVV